MDRFKDQRNIALQNMIDERKSKWDVVKNERDVLESKIGKLQAKIMFWDASGRDKDPTYNEMLNEKNRLLLEYQTHIDENKNLANTLDNEIILLENLKSEKVEE